MPAEYDRYAKLFHWTIALAVLVQYISAWTLPERVRTPDALVSFHMSFGILILALMLARFAWRAFAKTPQAHADMPLWQARLSLATHYALYALLVAMPLTGWLWASARGWQVTLFGLINLPALVPAQSALSGLAGGAHELISSAILALVGLHVAAALYHWLVIKDGVMQRMWP